MEISKNIKDIIRLYSLCTGNADKKILSEYLKNLLFTKQLLRVMMSAITMKDILPIFLKS